MKEFPNEIWVVFAGDSPDAVLKNRESAMTIVSLAEDEFPDLGPWQVKKYVASPKE